MARRWLGMCMTGSGVIVQSIWVKADFHFAAAHVIPNLMKTFEKKFLSVYMSCQTMDDETLIDALAKMHIEFILIHPFREGNGRLSRLLANIMALQAGQPILDFSVMENRRTQVTRNK